MADNSQLFPSDPDFTLDDSDAKALLAGQRQQLTSQFPYLAGNAEFNRDLDDAFSSFINQSTQKGTDYNNVWSKTVQPIVAKWSIRGAALPQREQAEGWKKISQGEKPSTVASENPLWLSSPSAQTLVREQTIRAAATPRLSPTDTIKLHALGSALSKAIGDDDDETAGKIEKEIDAFKPSSTPPSTPMPLTPINPPMGAAGATGAPALNYGPPVAEPQGTSGYVNPAGGNPKPIIYMGPQLSSRAEAQMFGRPQPSGPQTAAPASPLPATPPDTTDASPAPSLSPGTSQIIWTDTSGKPTAPPSPSQIASATKDLPPVRPPSAPPPAQPQTQQEFDALPKGALYINPADGKLYQKK
jgi:hypothetical protein